MKKILLASIAGVMVSFGLGFVACDDSGDDGGPDVTPPPPPAKYCREQCEKREDCDADLVGVEADFCAWDCYGTRCRKTCCDEDAECIPIINIRTPENPNGLDKQACTDDGVDGNCAAGESCVVIRSTKYCVATLYDKGGCPAGTEGVKAALVNGKPDRFVCVVPSVCDGGLCAAKPGTGVCSDDEGCAQENEGAFVGMSKCYKAGTPDSKCGCADDKECKFQDPFEDGEPSVCLDDGNCGCATDDQCGGAKPVCYDGVCGCEDSGDCDGDFECSTDTGECICLDDDDCANVADASRCVVDPANEDLFGTCQCGTNDDCPGGEANVCDTANNVCTCGANADCDSAKNTHDATTRICK